LYRKRLHACMLTICTEAECVFFAVHCTSHIGMQLIVYPKGDDELKNSKCAFFVLHAWKWCTW